MSNYAAWDKLIHGSYDEYGNYTSGLLDLAGQHYQEDLPEAMLIANIILCAGLERDAEYFKSDVFRWHCFLLHCRHSFVYNIIKSIWSVTTK